MSAKNIASLRGRDLHSSPFLNLIFTDSDSDLIKIAERINPAYESLFAVGVDESMYLAIFKTFLPYHTSPL